MAGVNLVGKLTKEATEFVVARAGTWGHDEWEGFCAQACEAGIELNDSNREALGNLLEAVRYFYQLNPTPTAAAKKKEAPCRKAAAKKSVSK